MTTKVRDAVVRILLADCRNWIRSRYPANAILPDHADKLLGRIDERLVRAKQRKGKR